MVIKTKLSTIIAAIATIAIITAMGGVVGAGQHQIALAQELNIDEIDDILDDIGSEEREICQDVQLPDEPTTICFRPPEALPCIGGVLLQITRDVVGEIPPSFICS
jgi:hypothetical protein